MGEQSLSNLLKVAIESPEILVDKDLEEIVFGTEKVEGLLFRQFFSFYLFHSKVFIVKFQFLWFNIIQKKLSKFFQQFCLTFSNNCFHTQQCIGVSRI